MIEEYLHKWENMTTQQKNYVKHNIFNISTLLAVLGFIVYQAKWQEKVDHHISDVSLHVSFEKQVGIFVPRVELDSRLRNIEKAQVKNAEMQTKILDILMSKK